MKKIKNALGRLYLKKPKQVAIFAVINFVLIFAFLFVSLIFAFCLYPNFIKALIFLGLFGGFFILFYFLIYSHNWAKELPEYTIKEAEKILKENSASPDFRKLKELIQQAKQTKKTDRLEQWMKDFKELQSIHAFEQEYVSFKKQFEELTRKRLRIIEQKSSLRLNLFY